MVTQTGKLVVSAENMTYNGRSVERGEVFCLQGARNDAKLLEHHIVREVGPTQTIDDFDECELCHKRFALFGLFQTHMREQHPVRARVEVGGHAQARRTPDLSPAERPPLEPTSDEDFAARRKLLAEL